MSISIMMILQPILVFMVAYSMQMWVLAIVDYATSEVKKPMIGITVLNAVLIALLVIVL